MSEFTCRNGHLIKPSVGYCEVCGGRATRMDGMTNREIEAQFRIKESYLVQRYLEEEIDNEVESDVGLKT